MAFSPVAFCPVVFRPYTVNHNRQILAYAKRNRVVSCSRWSTANMVANAGKRKIYNTLKLSRLLACYSGPVEKLIFVSRNLRERQRDAADWNLYSCRYAIVADQYQWTSVTTCTCQALCVFASVAVGYILPTPTRSATGSDHLRRDWSLLTLKGSLSVYFSCFEPTFNSASRDGIRQLLPEMHPRCYKHHSPSKYQKSY